MPPATPFLPSAHLNLDDQSFLLATEPVFDESFASWPPSPIAAIPGPSSGLLYEQSFNLDAYLPDDQTSLITSRDDVVARSSSLSKRLGGDTPMKRHGQKKAKVPTPVKDDFLSRRLKDSDRRSSLGFRHGNNQSSVSLPSPETARARSRDSLLSLRSTIIAIGDEENGEQSLEMSPRLDGLDLHHELVQRLQLPREGTFILNRILRTASRISLSTSSSSSTSKPIARSSALIACPEAPAETSLSDSIVQMTALTASDSERRGSLTLASRLSGLFGNLTSSRRASIASISISMPGKETGTGPETTIAGEGDSNTANEDAVHVDRLGSPGELVLHQRLPSPDPALIAQPSRTYTTSVPGAPRLRLPPALTRPAPRLLTTASRAAHSRPPVTSSKPNIPAVRLPVADKAAPPRVSRPTARTAGPRPAKAPTTTSAFAARAVARLPAPGRGSTSSSKPVQVMAAERARDLAAKREAFEAIARKSEAEKQKALAKYSVPPRVTSGMMRTVPMTGGTPGKASRQRAEERARFEQGLKERHEAKERQDEALRRARAELEREEMKLKRLETVVWAKPAPNM